MSELKPCPFCGGTKLIIKSCSEITEYNNFEKCKYIPYYAVCCDFRHGGCGAKSGYRPNRGEAIEAWNRRAGEWIPVSERLPNISGIVLVQRGTYAECKGKPIIELAKFTNRKTGFFEREKGFYQAWYSMPFKYDDVIAWMPLPPAFKESEE